VKDLITSTQKILR